MLVRIIIPTYNIQPFWRLTLMLFFVQAYQGDCMKLLL